MLPATSLVQMALCLSAFTGAALAQSPADHHRLLVRQNDDVTTTGGQIISFVPDASGSGTSESGKETESAKSDSDSKSESESKSDSKATKTTASGAHKTADLNTAKPGSGTRSGSSKPTHTSFSPDLPAGGAQMLTPTAIAGSTALYKIGDYVTLGWNYTSLLADPKHIDVLISCATASETWTLTSNMSFSTSVDFLWDTRKEANDSDQPLLTELYTLIIKDTEAEISEVPEAGYLGVYSGFTFGLYAPQPYTALPDWKCTGCNAAAPGFNGQAVGLALTMSMISVLSFTWFVTGLGLS